jgi:hypothetical protein
MWGSAKWDDRFEFPESGCYRIDVDTTDAFFQNGAWPILQIAVGDNVLPEEYLDTVQPVTTARWSEITAGRHRVSIRSPNNTFHEPFKHGDQDPRPDRGFTLSAVRLSHLPPRPARGGEPYVLRIQPRSALVAPNMPLTLTATVLDEWGRPVAAKITWKASQGATVSSDGTFTAAKPGDYTVTATAGDKTDEVTFHVAGSGWIERFDDQWADGWRLVRQDGDDATLSARWWKLHVKSDATAVAVFEPGTAWQDYSFVADVVMEEEHFSIAPTRGIVFRYQDAHNYYRFERAIDSDDSGRPIPICRLVRVVDGRQSELARSDQVPTPLVLSGRPWEQYPSHHVPGEGNFRPRAEQGVIERYCVEVRGPSIVCKLNDKTCFTLPDGGAGQGTVGICCAGGGSGVLFDNLEVTPPR